MFNRIKKRVKEAQDSHRKTRTSTNKFQDTEPIPPGANASRSTATDVAHGLASAAKVALEKQAIRSKASNRRTSRFLTDDNADHFVDPLSRFHGCIEAADALAATCPGAHDSKIILPARVDKDTGLADCSVLVSPDGDLLLIPQGEDQVGSCFLDDRPHG